ncbi:MAG: threonine-phosphate decarboxylase [Spirochaetae bacterium HGW-Spirochaetae-3]|jgi:cobyric acid synthase CobQ|nr:MAG: threonine-phosphate decarboxylase [Spirochaetae bacterium HGW-Spirochaetae-3]
MAGYGASPRDASPHTAARHGGDFVGLAAASGLPESSLLDASANLNPLGPPDWLDAAFAEGRRKSGRYPDPAYRELRAAAAERLGLPMESLVFGNGADELMYALARALARPVAGGAVTEGAVPTAIVEAPSYATYRDASEAAGFSVESVPAESPDYAEALEASPPGSALWLGAPNNPTGALPAGYPGVAASLASRFPDRFVVCDEAFMDFCDVAGGADGTDTEGAANDAARLPNLIVLRSMTKFWAVPGLRAGYAVCAPDVASRLRAELPNWPLNSVAESFARRAFSDPAAADRRSRTRAFVASERARVAEALAELPGLTVLPSLTNYYLVRVSSEAGLGDAGGDALADGLASEGIGVRRCRNFDGLGPGYVRIAVRSAAENDAIVAAIADVVEEARSGAPRPGPRATPRRAKALMIQGTSSGAGKSLIAAAFCRIFRDEGIDVAPYKAQNMSLNSAVTPDGLEIGRAQAVQAAACGLEPDARMNPVLLKPESDRGSQVVLLGKPYARYQAQEYYAMHELMRDTARAAYDGLASERELIVLEGAGSPAEINLKSRDFVNMGAARHAGARVLLVGDIDRGGVFASFIGHVATFAPDELRMLSGFVVNKFRGDPALLGDAFGMTRDRTGYPVLGCVPMISRLDIPDEDEPVVKAGSRPGADVRIAVPRLRRASNFTDLDAFAAEPDAEVVAVSLGSEIEQGRFDAVVIPGTKSTVDDLGWLRASGLAESILRFAASGGTVVGICGGYQMLGLSILDPDGVESPARETPGLGLLPLVTSFARGKTLSRTRARWVAPCAVAPGADDGELEGYEIHHGGTRLASGHGGVGVGGEADEARPAVVTDSGDVIGYAAGNAWGSYLHGIFDADRFRRSFLNGLRLRRALAPLPVNARPSLDSELSRLAAAVAANVDMAAIRAELWR